MTVSLIFRLLSLGTTRGLADHNLLLIKVGAEHRARSIFAEVAREAIKKINLYKDAIENKTLEAQNALIFGGRVALVEGRTAAAVLLFRAAKNLREDADAHLLIGKQMAAAGAFDDSDDGIREPFSNAADSDGNTSEPSRKLIELLLTYTSGRGIQVEPELHLGKPSASTGCMRTTPVWRERTS